MNKNRKQHNSEDKKINQVKSNKIIKNNNSF